MSWSVNWNEFSVNVDWGVLHGKRCVLGSAGTTPTLTLFCLHGWLDNANTYDRLVPLLPLGIEVLALDFPGHGLSDHLPDGTHYDVMTYVANVRAVVLKLGLSNFVLLAHSMGGIVANYYVALFPEGVKALIVFDIIIPERPETRNTETLRSEIKVILRSKENLKPPPVYSEEGLVDRFVNSRKGSLAIDRESAKALLPRSAKKVEGGFVWRHDPKVQGLFMMLHSLENWLYFTARIKCPMLLVRAKSGVNSYPDSVYKVYLDTYKANAQFFHYVMVEGSHHVHLIHPSLVAPHVNEFLQKLLTSLPETKSSKL